VTLRSRFLRFFFGKKVLSQKIRIDSGWLRVARGTFANDG